MSTGLAAWTVAPGSTAPELSFTSPAIALCAEAGVGIVSIGDIVKSRIDELEAPQVALGLTHAGVLDVCIHTSDCGIRPVIVGLHEVVQNALSEITLAQLVGTEEKVDARLHQIVKLQSHLRPMRSAS